ncbi:MAG: hypothetical protein KF713_02730 [Turneriella sp.]|jgi:DNA-directed RNA polymerase specialized sigma24 family protein|nr:hypothetical protein [Turneriella sp.]
MEDFHAYDWPVILTNLRGFTISRLRISEREVTETRADDFVMEAVTRFLTGDRKWDKSKEPELGDFLTGVINSLICDDHRSVKRQALAPIADDDVIAELADPKSTAEHHGIKLFERTLTLDEWNIHISDCANRDEDLELLVAMFIDGKKRADIAEELSWDIAKIYELSRQLKNCLQKKLQDQS